MHARAIIYSNYSLCTPTDLCDAAQELVPLEVALQNGPDDIVLEVARDLHGACRSQVMRTRPRGARQGPPFAGADEGAYLKVFGLWAQARGLVALQHQRVLCDLVSSSRQARGYMSNTKKENHHTILAVFAFGSVLVVGVIAHRMPGSSMHSSVSATARIHSQLKVPHSASPHTSV